MVPQQLTLNNLKNKIETFISNLFFEICTNQMISKRSWKHCKNLELTNNIETIFCVQGPRRSNVKLTNKGENVGTQVQKK